jgi:hypothetical protein
VETLAAYIPFPCPINMPGILFLDQDQKYCLAMLRPVEVG